MSGIWSFFGGGAAQKKDSPKHAVMGLRAQLELLQKREKYLQSQMDDQHALARKNASTNKAGKCSRLFRSKPELRIMEQLRRKP